MPRGKAIKFPSPEDVAKKLQKEERRAEQAREEGLKKLIQELSPELLNWGPDELQKTIGNSKFSSEEEQDAIAEKLRQAKWTVDSVGTGLIIARPVIKTQRKAPVARKPKEAASPAPTKTMRRAGRDPAPVTDGE